MRVYDNSQSWFDLDGKPLVGRVTFYKFHTTTPEAITDVNGTPLANPVFTNQIGQLQHNVFLKNDTDYTVYFEKYIGTGHMEDDPDNWEFQYSSDNVFTEYVIDIESEALQEVNNIDDLRAISPMDVETRDGHKIIRLLGYNAAGDKPEVLYIYDETSILSDNGGSVIKPDDEYTGRWLLVNTFEATNGIDVRHLGVFGTYTREAADTTSAQIAIANNYAVSVGIPLYFPRLDEGTAWYKINNMNITAMFADDTRVYSKSGSNTTINLVKEIDNLKVFSDQAYNGEFTINGTVIRTSYGTYSNNVHYNPSEVLVIDSNVIANTTASNVAVRAERIISGWTFDSCTFDGVIKKMGLNNTFTNCRLTELMFTPTSSGIVIDDTVTVDIEDWNNITKWWALRKQQSSRDLDLHGRTVSAGQLNLDQLNWTHCVIHNANLTQLVPSRITSIGFDNCSGSITIAGSFVDVSLDNSNLTTTFQSNTVGQFMLKDSSTTIQTPLVASNFAAVRSNVTGEYLLQCPSVVIKDTEFDIALQCGTIIAENSSLHEITCDLPSLTRCNLYGVINQNPNSEIIDFTIDNCTFNTGSLHAVASRKPDSVVNGKWINNISVLPHHFITLDRTNLNLDERAHGYVYENNNGPAVLQKLKAKWNDNVILCGAPLPILDSKQVTHALEVDNLISTKSRMNIIDDAFGNKVLDTNIYLTECTFFSVGTNANVMNFKLAVTPERRLINVPNQYGYIIGNTTTVDGLQLASQDESTSVVVGIKFINNYTWRIYQVYGLFDTNAPFWHSSYAADNWNVKVTYELEYAGPASWGTNII